MAVPVNISVVNDDVLQGAIEGVLVAVYESGELVTSASTNVAGVVGFLLPAGIYEARFFKKGVIFPGPSLFEVRELVVGTNDFDCVAHVVELPVSVDPRTCRCTGVLVGLDNRPMAGVGVFITAVADDDDQVPRVLDGAMVQQQQMVARSDAQGRVTVDLIRGARYHVTWSGFEDSSRIVTVPDRPAANLVDLIFPAPVELLWEQAEVIVPLNDWAYVPFSIRFSDFTTRTTELEGWVTISSSDGSIIEATFVNLPGQGAAIALRGLRPGVAEISARVRNDLRPARIPGYSIIALPLQVTAA